MTARQEEYPCTVVFFLFFHENIHCGYSLEAPHLGASDEYPQHMFLWRNKKDTSTFQVFLSYDVGMGEVKDAIVQCEQRRF